MACASSCVVATCACLRFASAASFAAFSDISAHDESRSRIACQQAAINPVALALALAWQPG